MKKIVLFAAVALLASVSGSAQKYDDIKGMLTLGQTDKAKTLYDKNSKNDKFFTKPEGYLIKSAIFGSMALDTSKAAEADNNRSEAYQAFLQYKEMEPDMKQVSPEDVLFKNVPFNLYASYFNAGAADINNKEYEKAYDKFTKTVSLSDLLIARKIATFTFDTNAVYYAGILAETLQKPDEAVKYNTRLADIKISGENYKSVYENLVRYYALKNDKENFEKYRALGKELYPTNDFFGYNLIDFAIGASGGFNEKIANLEKIINSNPNDYKANLALAEAIFDTLNSRKEGAVLPANYDELEAKMLSALQKAEIANNSELQPLLLVGDHFTTKSERIGDQMRPVETDIIKKGSKATAADKQKLADLKAKYDANYEKAKDSYLKAANIFAKKGELDAIQKRQYRIIVGNLAQYFSYKREDAKGAELNKIVAEETKYNNLYDQLRKSN
ncbi:MAG: hypothetical protein ACK5NK_03185 [Niabella sp.]